MTASMTASMTVSMTALMNALMTALINADPVHDRAQSYTPGHRCRAHLRGVANGLRLHSSSTEP